MITLRRKRRPLNRRSSADEVLSFVEQRMRDPERVVKSPMNMYEHGNGSPDFHLPDGEPERACFVGWFRVAERVYGAASACEAVDRVTARSPFSSGEHGRLYAEVFVLTRHLQVHGAEGCADLVAEVRAGLTGPSRTIIVEPLEAPVTEPVEAPPEPAPERTPEREPEKVPA